MWTGLGGTWFHRDRGYASGQRPPLPWRGERARVSDGNAEWSKTCWRRDPLPPRSRFPVILSAKSLIKPLLTPSLSLSLLPFLSFNFRWNIGIFRGVGIIIVYPQRYIFIAFQFYFNNVTATRLYRFLSLSLSILLCVYIYTHIFYTTTRLYLFKINFDFRSLRFIKKKVDIFAR